MSSRKSAADADLQRSLGRMFDSSKSCNATLLKSFKLIDSRRVKWISVDDFEECLLPYKLKSATIKNLIKRFAKSSNTAKIEYQTFVDHAVTLYLKGADDMEDDLEEETLDSDDQEEEEVRKRKKNKKTRRLEPTVQEDLLTQLQQNFSTAIVLEKKMVMYQLKNLR